MHKHIYDKDGNQLCCTPQEKKVNDKAAKGIAARKVVNTSAVATATHQHKALKPASAHDHSHEHGDDHDHAHHTGGNHLKMFLPAILSLALMMVAIVMDNWLPQAWFNNRIRLLWYIAAYIPVGFPVVKDAFKSIARGEIFSEFLLMSIATIGAFAIGEYPEGVAVMLFYSVGEIFQAMAVRRAKGNISKLLDQRPDEVTVLHNGRPKIMKAANAVIGDIIQLKPGEKLALDGDLISKSGTFNTAALTGESQPNTKRKGDTVLAGMINLNNVSEVQVTTAYADTKLSRILQLVQDATAQKAPTELFIRKFAKIYTPMVVFAAIGICLLPYFFVDNYVFRDWLYRALIFLVISCPCALVISIPLGYFGGIGAASRNGILFKGGNFLDVMARVKHVVMDKTGTLTEGLFRVQEAHIKPGFNRQELLQMVNTLESKSTHPVATAIHEFVGEIDHHIPLEQVEEIPGYGLKAMINGKELLAGNFRLLDKENIPYDIDPAGKAHTQIAIAYDKKFAGYLTIADSIKQDAGTTIARLNRMGIQTTMLSGDKSAVVQDVARQLGILHAYGDLLPEDKVNKLKEIKARHETVAFVGDGVNDAPVVALSDAGIAMGGLGSDATIETADVVIQDDMPSKIPMAINIGRQTKKIVWQNIALAFVVKAAVLLLGAGGLATMWEAVFADVGVALLAILNAVRVQRMRF